MAPGISTLTYLLTYLLCDWEGTTKLQVEARYRLNASSQTQAGWSRQFVLIEAGSQLQAKPRIQAGRGK